MRAPIYGKPLRKRASRPQAIGCQTSNILQKVLERAVLIVKLSSLGDVVHDIRCAHRRTPREGAPIRAWLGKLSRVDSPEFDLRQRALDAACKRRPYVALAKHARAWTGMRSRRFCRAPAMAVLCRVDDMDCPTEEALIGAKLEGIGSGAALESDLVMCTLSHAPVATVPAAGVERDGTWRRSLPLTVLIDEDANALPHANGLRALLQCSLA